MTVSGPEVARMIDSELNIKISSKTAKRRIAKYGFLARSPRKVPFISPPNKIKRLESCLKWIKIPMSFWKRVIWSDETKINLFKSDGNTWVWRFNTEEYEENVTLKTVKHGGGSMMLWGCINARGVGNMVEIKGIMDRFSYLRILQENLTASAEKLGLGSNFVFQQDNDPKHTAKIIKEYFKENNIETLDWPPQSPDLNVIENLWYQLKKKYHENPCSSKSLMLQRLQQIWQEISSEFTETLVASVYRRFEAVIRAKGGATKY